MRFLLVLILAVFIVFGCEGKEGPMGPVGRQGPQGNPGNDAEFTILEGTLSPGDPDYWIFEPDIYLDNCVIYVRVSVGRDFTPTWIEPTWYFEGNKIYIWKDIIANSGDRYIIIILSKSDTAL